MKTTFSTNLFHLALSSGKSLSKISRHKIANAILVPFTVLFCLAILSLVIGCATVPKEGLSSTISNEISGFGDLDVDLDVSDLESLDMDLASALEGLEI